jgi:hypothetical protein
VKKLLTTVFLSVIVLISMAHPAQKETFLRLPVRVLSGDKVVDNLTKDDFNLRINGKKEEIVEFKKNNRSLLKVNSPRHFVLAFNITDYYSQIADGISYFVKNILKQGDSLLVWSPVNMYQIFTNKDKKNIIETIEEIVKRDTLSYKKNITHPSETLDGIISQYYTDIRDNQRSETWAASKRTIAQFFLSNYSRELKSFKSRFILPNLIETRKVAALLSQQDGEKWIINFQEREIIPSLVRYRKVAEEITEIANSLTGNDMANATRMYTVLNIIEKTNLISESLPMKKIINSLLEANISYNAILFKSPRKAIKMGIGDSVAYDLDDTFKHISKLTGGVAVVSTNFSEGLDMIRKGNDIYYDLTFKINAGSGEKAVSVDLAKSNANTYYKQLFTKKEIESIFENLNEPGIKLTGIDLKEQVLKFSISDYKLGAPGNKQQGLIGILVELMDEKDTAVYKTRKILESQKKSIDVSLELPSKYKGYFKVRINAFDLITNKGIQLSKYEKL